MMKPKISIIVFILLVIIGGSITLSEMGKRQQTEPTDAALETPDE